MSRPGAATLSHAVIGGGVAGTYAAWRLAGAGHGPVGLFEYSERIGGRLLSVTLPGLPNIPAELGGMRFMPKSHLMVRSVVDHLRLETKPFPMGNPAREDPHDENSPVIGSSRNLLFLRGRRFTEAEFADPAKVPYDMLPSERGLSPTALQFQVMRLLGGDSTMTTDQWFALKAFGEPLYNIGYWNLLGRMLSAEAYAFMTDAGGYVANTANANSVYQLPATEYGDAAVEYRALSKGFETLPRTLEARFREAGGRTFLGHALRRIERRDDGVYRLIFSPTRLDRDRRTVIDEGAPTVEQTAAAVILAMPRRSLELIDWPGWRKVDGLLSLRGAVLVQHAFKLVFGYTYPWWRALGLVAGRSITDLPLRQVYYMESEEDYANQTGAQDANRSALLMATYNDISTVPFWRGLERGTPFCGYKTPWTGEERPVPSLPVDVTAPMVEAAQEQLAQMHGLKAVPPPYTAAYHDWSDDPFGGGWHEWKAGYRYDHVIDAMMRPVRDEDVFVCGEAYSSDQGWVEGSLDTAETMLEHHLKLKRPAWVDQNWTAGG